MQRSVGEPAATGHVRTGRAHLASAGSPAVTGVVLESQERRSRAPELIGLFAIGHSAQDVNWSGLMKKACLSVAFAMAVGSSLAGTAAHAQSRMIVAAAPADARDAIAPPREQGPLPGAGLDIAAYGGGQYSDTSNLVFGSTAIGKLGAYRFGGFIESYTSPLSLSGMGGGGVAGVGLRASQLRLDVLATLGIHSYRYEGGLERWSVSGSTPFAGGRVSVEYVFAERYHLGVQATVEDDLMRKTESVRTSGCSIFCGLGGPEPDPVVKDVVIGRLSAGAALRAGVDLDF
jgi:hypothetical protein